MPWYDEPVKFLAGDASMTLHPRFGVSMTFFADEPSFTLDPDTSTSLGPLVMRTGLGSASMRIGIRRQWVMVPGSLKPEYQIKIKDVQGNYYGELENVRIEQVPVDVLNETATFTFSLDRKDPKCALLIAALREIEVWRGGHLIGAGVVIDIQPEDDGTNTYVCSTLDWYFYRRVIGLVPTPNLLRNGSFEQGEKYWGFTYAPKSIPAAPPVHKIVHDTINGENALHIEGVTSVSTTVSAIGSDVAFPPGGTTLSAAGRSAVKAVMSKIKPGPFSMYIEGHTDNLPHYGSMEANWQLSLDRAKAVKNYAYTLRPDGSYTIAGKAWTEPVASNATDAGRAKNRRVEMSYTQVVEAKGHRQYGYQRFKITQPTEAKKKLPITLVGWCKITEYDEPSKDGWGVYMQAKDDTSGKIVATGFVSINNETPKNRWTRMECSMLIPANGREHTVEVRVYPPAGVCIWDEIGVTAAHQLGFFGKDQATIFKELVEHLQDPAMGKSDVRITPRTALTGRKRTREYPFSERMEGHEALYEWTTLADGMDITIELTPEKRYITTHHPRKARVNPEPLALGKNLLGYGVTIQGGEVSSTIIVQADGEGSDREEGVVQNTSKTNGLVLEKVYNATPGSAISSLQKQAERGYKRYGQPIVVTEVATLPGMTSEMLDTYASGDIVRVVIQDDYLDVDALYRITGMFIDTASDALGITLHPED